ncbi:MAG TPA: hypothetical protein VFO60_02510 [Candidatus Dormibacteraeota bacterium]|nr:hypothetical protein [Candidatus Dormibacteraeota bacterium]
MDGVMAHTAYSVATLPLRRRMLGSLVVVAGALVVCAGFFVAVTGEVTTSGAPHIIIGDRPISAGGGAGTAAYALHHLVDHGLASGSAVNTAADFLYRAGVVAMAGAAALALLLLLTPARGLIGAAAGIGFIGVALVGGVTAGQSAELSTASAGSLHTDVGIGVVVLAVGFVAILAGGAVAAFRPLAGVISGVTLAILAVVAGIVCALVVGGNSIATRAGAATPPGPALAASSTAWSTRLQDR